MIEITDPSDPRIAPFVDLRKARSVSASKANDDYFIAEGKLVVKRLIESDYQVDSLLVQSGKEQEFERLVPNTTPVYSISAELLKSIVGFDFHRGVLACASRRPLHTTQDFLQGNCGTLVLGLLGISDPENLGGMLRTAAALGVNQILLGQNTIDPFSRRVIRVSMATALKHRFYQLEQPIANLTSIQVSGVQIVASTLEQTATPLNEIDHRKRPTVLLIGNEANGLDAAVQQMADIQVRVPMKQSVDSLNAASAAAILMYELREGI